MPWGHQIGISLCHETMIFNSCTCNIMSFWPEVRAQARAEQEAKWAGDYDGRQHWSLREACARQVWW